METADTPAILLLNLPNSALAGIDLLSFTTTPRFRGVKNLPSGLHFAFVGSTTAFSERHGVWFSVSQRDQKSDLIVTKWNGKTETLEIEKDEAELLRWRGNLGSIWREGLTLYRQVAPRNQGDEINEASNDWHALTANINRDLLTRITTSESWKLSSASSSRSDLEEIPGLTIEDLNLEIQTELQFLPIDLKQTWREGATGRERTDAAQDRSWALEHLIEASCRNGNANEIIGELQFCFLMVLTLNNFSCFEQWKRILSILFTCKAAVLSRPDLFISAIAAIRLQLQHCKDAEGGLIDLTDEGGSLLKSLLVRFHKGLESSKATEAADVVDELDDLEDYLKEEHGWQFGGSFVKTGMLELEDGEQVRMHTTAFDEDDETGEFAPQIVDLSPEQARLLGVEDDVDLPKALTGTSLKNAEVEVVESSEGETESELESESEGAEEVQDLDDMDARY